MTDRTILCNAFGKRLNSLLQREGYTSQRSRAGTDVSQLAKVAGVSFQMARKYALGLALPDYHILPKIANWLNVSPSWLLFGEHNPIVPEKIKSNSNIEIETDMLKYILTKCAVLFPNDEEPEKVMNYITSVIYDASHIEADKNTVLKMIDMMISSAIQLSNITAKKRA